MRANQSLSIFVILVGVLLTGCMSQPEPISLESYRSPDRFEKAVAAFEKADAVKPPPAGAVVCTGSSSIRMWHKYLSEDLEPLTVIGRGFGGSNMNDLLHYLDRLVIKHKPRAVLIYEGDNDIAQGIEPKVIAEALRRVIDRIDAELPGCRVYILPAKPSLSRLALWPKMLELNAKYAEIAAESDRVTYIDIATPMLNDEGKPRPELFVKDGLHLNREGYKVWTQAIRPIMVQAERQYEN